LRVEEDDLLKIPCSLLRGILFFNSKLNEYFIISSKRKGGIYGGSKRQNYDCERGNQ
jgi:hypothetical protein